MRPEIKYIELKSGFSDDGPAWIGLVSFSKSGKTIFFDGKALQSLNGTGISGNYVDLESGEEYWISGVKQNMSDRHWAGGGKVMVEKRILKEYLQLIDRQELPKSTFEMVEVDTEIPIEKIYERENQQIEASEFDSDLHFKQPNELSFEELKFVIDELIEDEVNAKFNKGRRWAKRRRVELEEELEKRIKNIG